MSNAFPAAFLEPLLRMTLSRDAATRRIVQEILHSLLDRHNNLDKLKTVRFVSSTAVFNICGLGVLASLSQKEFNFSSIGVLK